MRGKAFSFEKNSFCSACGGTAAARTFVILWLAAAAALAFPLGKVARCGAVPHRTVTDEGSPPSAGLTATRTFVILWLAAAAASAPLCRTDGDGARSRLPCARGAGFSACFTSRKD